MISSLFFSLLILFFIELPEVIFNESVHIFNNIFLQKSIIIILVWALSVSLMILSRTWIYYYNVSTNIEDQKSQESRSKNTVLIIGGAGYIGSSLTEKLLKENFEVKVLDILFFGKEPINKFIDHPRFSLIQADFRKVDDLVMAMQDCKTVIHLGGLVGDPACSVDEYLTTEVNLTSTKIVCQIAKAAGVERFIFASSCSIYGAQDDILDEESEGSPLSLYAKTKLASETVIKELSSDTFTPVILRFATVFGLSGRTRFDLVVNLLTAKACVDKSMTVFGAEQTRPFVHVSDAANSILCALKAQKEDVHNEVFNIGSSDLNYTLLELAELIKEQVPDSSLNVEETNDARNYNVSFEKAKTKLNFQTEWTLEEGIKQVVDKFNDNEIRDYSSIMHSNFMHMSENGRDVLGSLEYSGWEKELLEAQFSSD